MKFSKLLKPSIRNIQLALAGKLGAHALRGRKVYDLILFNQELELLEVRLNYLDPLVDFFVIGESALNFIGEPKRMHFHEQRSKFQRFEHKIRHVIIPPPTPADYRDNHMTPGGKSSEHYHRLSLAAGLAGAQPDDLVLYSDADEIPQLSAIRQLASLMSLGQPAAMFQMEWHLLHLDAKAVKYANDPGHQPCKWLGTIGTTAGELKNSFANDFNQLWQFRWGDMRDFLIKIPLGGWHLSYLGGLARLKQKQRDGALTVATDEMAALRRHEFLGVKFEFLPLHGLFPREFQAHLEPLHPFLITKEQRKCFAATASQLPL